jgi:hypothetical protein
MRALIAAAMLAAITGCQVQPPSPVVDQCMRREIFQECMQSLPAGPTSTRYNDWDEVVDSCESTAHYQSRRAREHVRPECAL